MASGKVRCGLQWQRKEAGGELRPPSAAHGGRWRGATSYGTAWPPTGAHDGWRGGCGPGIRRQHSNRARVGCFFYFLNRFLEAGDPFICPKFHFKGRIRYPPPHEVGAGTGSISKNLFLLVPRNCFRSSDYTVYH